MKKNNVIDTDYSKVYYNHLGKLNAVISREFPNVKLVRGKGYFYIASDDEEMALKIVGLYTSSIPVYSLKHQSVAKWINDVRNLLNQDDNY